MFFLINCPLATMKDHGCRDLSFIFAIDQMYQLLFVFMTGPGKIYRDPHII